MLLMLVLNHNTRLFVITAMNFVVFVTLQSNVYSCHIGHTLHSLLHIVHCLMLLPMNDSRQLPTSQNVENSLHWICKSTE